MKTEIVNNNPIPSPLDQAYKKYKDDLSLRITGKKTDDLARGIMEETVPRDKIGELKKQIITPQDFKSYYFPREMSGVSLKEDYRYDVEEICYGGYIYALDVLSDGRMVYGGDENNIYLRSPKQDVYDKEKIGEHKASVNAICVLSDDSIVSGSNDKQIYLWTRKTDGDGYQKKWVGENDGYVFALQTLPGGKIISGGGGDNNVCIWTPKIGGGYEKKEVGRHKTPVRCLQVLPDGRIISGDEGDAGLVPAEIWMWYPNGDGYDGCRLGEYESGVNNIQVLSNGEIFFNTDNGNILACMDKTDLNMEVDNCRKISSGYGGFFGSLQVLSNGIIISGRSNQIYFLTPKANNEYDERSLFLPHDYIKNIKVLPDGRILFVSGQYIHILK